MQLLIQDVTRLRTRVGKLDAHFRQAQDDVSAITISTDKIIRRGDKIEQIEFVKGPDQTAPVIMAVTVETE